MRIDLGRVVSLGATLTAAQLLKQEFEGDSEINSIVTDVNNNIVRADTTKIAYLAGKLTRSELRIQTSAPFASLPAELRFGIAFHPSPLFLWTLDVSRHSSGEAAVLNLTRSAMVNYATGMELRPAGNIIIRGGLFTNLDSTGSRDVFSEFSHGEYMDYFGFSSQFSLKSKGSEYSLSYVQQKGKGESEKVQSRKINLKGQIKFISLSASEYL